MSDLSRLLAEVETLLGCKAKVTITPKKCELELRDDEGGMKPARFQFSTLDGVRIRLREITRGDQS